jgi:hypothetical protein
MWQEKLYSLSQIGNDQAPVFFDMPRNSTVQQKGSSAVLVRMSGLYHNPETFNFKFVNRLPISGPKLKVASKTLPSDILHNFCTPFFDEKIGKKVQK